MAAVTSCEKALKSLFSSSDGNIRWRQEGATRSVCVDNIKNGFMRR